MPTPPRLEALEALDRPLAPELGAKGKTISVRRLLFPIALSLIVLGVVFWATYEPETLARMSRMNVGILALAVLAVGLRILLSGVRISYISRGSVDTLGGVRGGLAWDFLSGITPSAMGGAPLAAYVLARENKIPVGEATAIMIFSMLTDQVWFALSIPLVLLAAPFLDIIPNALGPVGAGTVVFFLVGMLAWAVFFAYATLIRPTVLEAIATNVVRIKWLRRWRGRVMRGLVSMRQRGRIIRGQPPRFYVTSFLLAVGVWTARYAALVLVILSVHPTFDILTGIVRTTAMTLTGLVVPTPGGSGGVEGLYVLFFSSLVPQALLGPTLVTWRLLSYHLFLAIGFVVMIQFAGRLRATSRRAD
jgi:glycosyltransferase 2 family protein